MKKYILLLVLPLLVCCKNSTESKKEETTQGTTVKKIEYKGPPTVYYLIRHAEKDRSNADNQDPNLTIEGLKHAKRWAEYFEPINLDAVYSTTYLRTRQTVSLIAQQKQITIKPYDPATLYSEDFLKRTRRKHTLIVGHSNTIPKLVNNLIGEEKFGDMPDDDNSTLYKVTIDGNGKKVETFTVK